MVRGTSRDGSMDPSKTGVPWATIFEYTNLHIIIDTSN